MSMRSFEHDLSCHEPLVLDGQSIKLEDVVSVARCGRKVVIADQAKDRIRRSRDMVELLLETGEKVYGLTTGFGKLRDIAIEPEDTKKLQVNLIRSHACGVGDPFDEDVVRAATLLRANTLCRGNSGIRLSVVQQLVNLLNDNIYPYIPQKGSVGASGDLAPLSHLGLVLIGDSEGRYLPRSERRPDRVYQTRCASDQFVKMPEGQSLEDVASEENWSFRPVELEAKEGLAINNGTQFMNAVGCLAIYDAFFTIRFAELSGALSLEAIRGIRDAFDQRIHEIRPQPYQAETARRVIDYCGKSQIIDLYLNTAHLHRAEIHLKVASEFLERLKSSLATKGIEIPATLQETSNSIADIQAQFDGIFPKDENGDVDSGEIETWAMMTARQQIGFFHDRLMPLRHRAVTLLRSVEKGDFPVTSDTRKMRTALVGAVDQINKMVPDSPIIQDDYSFRCYPQVLSVAYTALWHVCNIIEVEINSATDNPLLFPPEPEGSFDSVPADDYASWLRADPERLQQSIQGVVGGGNFHGEPLAVGLDYLAIAMAEVANIAERRIAHLVDENHSRGLPSFLIESSGLNSGFMVPQYTAAALVSENKILSHPASIDSIPTCANTEDHVSMGTISARKAMELIENVRYVIAIEILAAYQGLQFREPLQPGEPLRKILKVLEEKGVKRYEDDRVLYPDMEHLKVMMRDRDLLNCLL